MNWPMKSQVNAENDTATRQGKQMLPLLVCGTAFITALLALPVAADDSEYAAWRQQTLGEFQRYLDDNDKAFLKRLESDWRSVDLLRGEPVDSAPKPRSIPEAPEPVSPPSMTDDTPDITIAPLPDVSIPDLREPPAFSPPVLPARGGLAVDVSFYNYDLSLPYTQAMQSRFDGPASPDTIAAYYQQQASVDINDTLDQFRQWQSSLQLSDWASAQLIATFAENVVADDTTRTLLSWFLLLQMGLDARLAYQDQGDDNVWLLLPADEMVYETSFFTLDNTRYYALPLRGPVDVSGPVQTYGGQFEGAVDPLRFSPPDLFTATGEPVEHSLSFYLGDDRQDITIRYPLSQIAYLDSLPQLDLKAYPQNQLPEATWQDLARQLRPLLTGKTEEQAANTLLTFVQTAFAYKTDEQQFQRENYLYPLETLHYPASDCEDRAALFALLVHELLGLPVVLTDYPGHVATAIAFSAPVKGDNLTVDGQIYTVTDPTYVNARAGMTMPEYAGQSPAIVSLFPNR